MPVPPVPPRIAYLTGQYPAVSHTFILREVEELRAAGHDIITCSVRAAQRDHLLGPSEQDAANSTYYIQSEARNILKLLRAQSLIARAPARYFATLVKAWRMRAPGLKAAIWQLFYFLEATLLAHHLKAVGASHLHNHFAGPSASVAILAADLADLEFSFTLHGPADLLAPDRWCLAQKAARARFVACISDFARSQLMLHSDPADWDRYKIIHCGVMPDRYDAPREAPSGTASPHLVFVGRLAAVKGLRVLMDAFATARQSHPNLRLTIVGDGPDRAWLEEAAHPYGDDVRLTGYLSQSDVAKVLATADVFVLPSFAEGVPVVLMEAMASRMPVVATMVAGVPELVRHGVSGLLVPPGNAAALADAICDLASDPDRRSEMGRAGRAYVEKEFNIATEARKLGVLFETTENG